MSRINYSDDEDFPGQFELWQANCRRSLQGRKGQAALIELRDALLALPEKRLIADELENADGGVCAIGALAKAQGRLDSIAESIRADSWDGDTRECDMEEIGVELGMPNLVAWKIVEINDIELDARWNPITQRTEPLSPEVRYERMLAWVEGQIRSVED